MCQWLTLNVKKAFIRVPRGNNRRLEALHIFGSNPKIFGGFFDFRQGLREVRLALFK